MRAIDIDTGDVAWEIAQRGPVILKTWSGVLATAGESYSMAIRTGLS